MRLTLQVLASAALVIAVLWAMFRVPRRGESLFGWAPPMALLGTWLGLGALVLSILHWVLPQPDYWVTLNFLILDPASIALGVLVLWIYRGYETPSETVAAQRLQARVAIALGLLAVGIGYVYVMTHKTPLTTIGE